MESHRISLSPAAVVRSLGAAALLLVLASTAGQLAVYLAGYPHVHPLVRLFYVDAERNIPTGFSTLLLLLAALLLWAIAGLERRQGSRASHWAVLASGFLLMAADEAWSFHEKLSKPIRKLLGREDLGVFYYAWVIPGIALVLVLALVFSRFLWRLPARTRRAFLTAAALYLGGVLGFELLGSGFDEANGRRNLVYMTLVTVEEVLEMAGVLLFVWALLDYLAGRFGEVRVRFERP